jgi:hypothetical protein
MGWCERSRATVCSPWFCLICPNKYRDAAQKPKKKKGIFVTFVTTKVKASRGHSGTELLNKKQ